MKTGAARLRFEELGGVGKCPGPAFHLYPEGALPSTST